MFGRCFCTLAAVTLLLTAGCHNNYEMPPPEPPPAAVVDSNLKIAFHISPVPVRQMDRTTLVVRLSNAHGAPVEGAMVRADLVMPSMDMGGNSVVLTPTGKGTYTGIGRFSMDGHWLVNVTAARGQKKTVESFPIVVR